MTLSKVYVTTAAEAAELDALTIARGTPSAELMRRAGRIAAREIQHHFSRELTAGACVITGSGNNGGDGWIVAAALSRAGVAVTVVEAAEPRTDDAVAAREFARDVPRAAACAADGVIVDALLGTGATGTPRGRLAEAIAAIGRAREGGAKVTSLDIPSGLDATLGTGEAGVNADLTVTFGTVKRGLLRARDKCGRIVVADIGLDEPEAKLPVLVTTGDAASLIPPIPAAAHKGSRGGVVVLGGGKGMAGAAILAAEGCLRAGAGSVRICVHDDNVGAVHAGIPPALVVSWSDVKSDPDRFLTRWPEAVVVGPGLGDDAPAAEMLELAMTRVEAPIVLDADALNLMSGKLDGLRARLKTAAIPALTPHPGEMKRLLADGRDARRVDDDRYDVVIEAARRSGAVVLLKGVPTVIATPEGAVRVNATGTPALATGGSGDVLSGVIGALLAQGVATFDAVTAGAWAHGRAAELATGQRTSRGITLEDVVERLRDVWTVVADRPRAGVLAELPPIL